MFFLKKNPQKNKEASSASQYQLAQTHYLIVLVHTTLERLGLFDVLQKKGGGITIDELSKIIKVRVDLLESCINFLWSTTEYLEKTDRRISLKNDAPKWFWTATYKPVFDNLE